MDGYADVREEYVFTFETQAELNEFSSLVESLGNSYDLWKGKVEELATHIGKEKDLTYISLVTQVFKESMRGKIILYYKTKAAYLAGAKPTEEIWLLSTFNFPRQEGALFIPEGYFITIELPSSAKIVDVEPGAQISGTTVSWEGPLTTLSMYIKYELPRPIVLPSPVDLSAPWLTVIAALVVLFILLRKIERKAFEYASKSVRYRK